MEKRPAGESIDQEQVSKIHRAKPAGTDRKFGMGRPAGLGWFVVSESERLTAARWPFLLPAKRFCVVVDRL